MTLIDWFAVLIYLVLVVIGRAGLDAVSLLFLVLAIIVERILVERLPIWKKPTP